MTMHIRDQLLAGAASIAAPERKEFDPTIFSAEVKTAIDNLATAQTEFRAKNDERLKQVERRGEDAVTKDELKKINDAVDALLAKANKELKARIDEIEVKQNRLGLNGAGKKNKKLKTAEQIEYAQKFEDFFRKGEEAVGGKYALRDLEKKAVAGSTDIDPSGGFTVLPEIDRMIDQVLKEISPIRQISTVRQISTSSLRTLVNQHGVSSGWVGEKESRVQTLAPDLTEVEFPVMEIYAMPAATQTLLDDSFIDIGEWLASEIDLEFAQQEGRAFIAGDGVKKPRGFIGGYPIVADSAYAWGSIGYVPTGLSAGFTVGAPADSILSLIFALKKFYRPNASFVMNRATMGAVRKLKDGQGNYLVNLRLADNAIIENVFGYPVTEAEGMPDVAANSYSIAFGDFKRAYLVVDRIGTRVLRDPFTSKPYVLFYTTKRVGGGVKMFEAIKLLKFAVS